jgi:aminobenzoyl-glutamate transport protein
VSPVEQKPDNNPVGLFEKFLLWLERTGNKLPDPLTIFATLAAVVLVISLIGSVAGFSAIHPLTKKTIETVNLLSVPGLQQMISNAVSNFTGFPPLGIVLVAILGVGLAEKTGLFSALLRKTLVGKKGNSTLVVAIIIFVAINANAAGDTGFIVMPPIAAMVFSAIGKNPLAGMLAAYAAVAGGFAANMVVNSLDVLVVGFTQAAVNLLDKTVIVNPAANWYFLMVSCIILTVVATWVTVKIVEPRMGVFKGQVEVVEEVTEQETKALKAAGIGLAILLIIIAALSIPESGLLREPKTHSLISYSSPFMRGLIALLTLAFFVPAYIYGKVSGKIKSDKDTAAMLGQSMSEMGPYIVLSFVIAQFISYFNWSNLGLILAIKGAEIIKASGAPAPVLLVLFITLSAIINLFIGSCSAKWAILAPIFVPMFMLLGFHPALTQMAYRIGDSVTNVITPLLPYFVILLAFVKKYDKDIGMGTLMANMLPYTLVFFVVWTAQLLIWFALKLPLGPGSPLLL